MNPAATRDTYVPAGLGRRLAAIAYDLLLLVGLAMLTGFVALALQYLADGVAEPQPTGGVLFQFALLAVAISYFAGCWHWLGQTPGMRAWGLALLNERGQRGGLVLCVLRFFCCTAVLATAGLRILVGPVGSSSALLARSLDRPAGAAPAFAALRRCC